MTDEAPAQRFKAALDMAEFGIRMYTSRMRREFPRASDAEILSKVNDWMLNRPDSALGEAFGRPSRRFALTP